ncbi:MAG: hypothetical protein HXM47_04790, partial [Pseudoleptotrichia goodfellowii]|nr:hypothetical protein [Pseudoleptotrichia goodfellowii]
MKKFLLIFSIFNLFLNCSFQSVSTYKDNFKTEENLEKNIKEIQHIMNKKEYEKLTNYISYEDIN